MTVTETENFVCHKFNLPIGDILSIKKTRYIYSARATLVLLLHIDGYPSSYISNEIGRPINTVNAILRNIKSIIELPSTDKLDQLIKDTVNEWKEKNERTPST